MLSSQSVEVRPRIERAHESARENVTLEDRLTQAAERKLDAKEHVFCEGDPRTQVYRVEEGVVAIYKTLFDGRRRIIDFAYPGDFIGLGMLSEHIMGAQATCPTRVRCLSASALESLAATDATLALKLYKSVCQDLAAARRLLVTLGQRSAVERVAAFLLALNRRNGRTQKDIIKLDMRRSDIADLLGLTIETVSRTLTKLREMGIIDVQHGGTTVRILDLNGLTDLANE